MQNCWSKAKTGDSISQASKLELSERLGKDATDDVGHPREAVRGVFQNFPVRVAG